MATHSLHEVRLICLHLFGHNTGTIRAGGLRWVNPFVRLRNHETVVAKVNDADSGPNNGPIL